MRRTRRATAAVIMVAMGAAVGAVRPTPKTVVNAVARAPAVGTIQGTVSVNARPPRRSANRYPGGSTAARTVQSLPAVAFIEGRVQGRSVTPPSAIPTMTQRDTAFVPSVLVVPVGGFVSFPNGDSFFHNVFSYSSAGRFDLGRYPMGETKEVTFDEAGIVSVYCEVHEFMRAAIIVAENPHYAVVGADGSFSIEDVPAGEYTLAVWHADHGIVQQSVTVADGGTARVTFELG